jgi:hypothetical protein
MKLYTAMGRVRVFSRLSTWENMKLFHEKIKLNVAAVTTPGMDMGRSKAVDVCLER